MSLLGEEEKHESWGMIGFSRITGKFKDHLFNCDVDTGTAIALRIKTCSRKRSLSTTWLHGEENIVEVLLSPSQFSNLLTTMNIGDGVPCTINTRHTENFKRMERPPKDDLETTKVKNEFKKEMDEFKVAITEHREKVDFILSKKSINKTDKEEIKSIIHKLEMFFGSNSSFILDMFQESSEKIINEAKAEIDSALTTMIMKTGIKELQKINHVGELIESKD